MKKNKLLIAIGAVVLIVVGIISFLCYKDGQLSDASNIIRIATVLPLTGEFGKEGELARKVFDYSARAFNERNSGMKIELKHHDGKYAPKDSLMAYNKAVSEKPSVIIVYGDVPCNCLSKTIAEGELPVVAIAADNDIPHQSSQIFRGWVSTKLENKTLAEFAYNDLSKHAVAILYLKNNFGDIARDNFRDAFGSLGGRIVSEESFDATDSTLRSQVAKILSSQPEAIYVIGFGLSFSTAINQIKEARFSGPILSNTIISVPSVNKNIINRGEGVYFIDTAFDAKVENSFSDAFASSVGEAPTSFGAFEYEIVRLIGEIGVEYGKNSKQIQKGLSSLRRVKTLMGDFSYDNEGEVAIKLMPKQMRADGTFVPAR